MDRWYGRATIICARNKTTFIEILMAAVGSIDLARTERSSGMADFRGREGRDDRSAGRGNYGDRSGADRSSESGQRKRPDYENRSSRSSNDGGFRPQADRPRQDRGERRDFGDRPRQDRGERRDFGDRPRQDRGERRDFGDRPRQ